MQRSILLRMLTTHQKAGSQPSPYTQSALSFGCALAFGLVLAVLEALISSKASLAAALHLSMLVYIFCFFISGRALVTTAVATPAATLAL